MSATTNRVKQWLVLGRLWYLYDAKWQNPFDSANKICNYLYGKHKPVYHALSDVGDHVIVINTRHIAMPGDEWRRRVYFHHTGYPGGATWTLAYELHKKDPTMVLWKAVYKQLGGSLLRRAVIERLHCFPDDRVPPEMLANVSGQMRQLRPVPKRLDEYSEDEIKKFPKIVDWPESYVIK